MSSTTSTAPKEVGENVIHVHIIKASATLLTVTLLMLTDTFLSLLIVDSSLIRIGKSFIGICNFLELDFGSFRVVLVLVWVILDGELFESLFYFIFRRVSFQAHKLVVVFSFWLFLPLLLLVSLTTTMTTKITTMALIVVTMLSLDQRAYRSIFPTS